MNPEEIKRCSAASPPPGEVRLTPWASIADAQFFFKELLQHHQKL